MRRDEARRPSILIVDDTTENLDILKRALMEEYMVRPATNGPLALRLAAMDPQPDLILLDVMMPGMDGYEVCRQLKKEAGTRDIPVIFITAKSGDLDELTGLSIGAVDYLTKPISPPIVQARVRTHLALRSASREMEEKNRRLQEINERLTDSMEQLSASEERFRGLVQTIPDIVYKIDAEGRFVFLNRSVERLGYHQSDLIGKHFSEIVYSADIRDASLQKVLERIGRGSALPGQKVFDERRTGLRMTVGLIIRLRTKGGGESGEAFEIKPVDERQTVRVEVNSTGLYGEVGSETSYRSRQYIGTVGVIRDISDRLKMQNVFMEERQLLRQLIDAVPHPIFFAESDGRLAFANETFRYLFQVEGDDLEGVPLNQPALDRLISDLQDHPEVDRVRGELTLTRDLGQERFFDVILLKFQRSAQALPAIIGVMVEVTEQREFTARLVQARKHAEAMAEKAELASRSKGEFLANMSHEIRTPLNAVIGLTHLCLQTELTERQRSYLSKVSVSANALLQLLNDILDFSRIEAGRLLMENVAFTLDEVLGGVVAILGVKSQEKGLELLLRVDRQVPHRLKGDAHRLSQVLTNLVGNAVKFTDRGEVVVAVTVAEEGPGQVVLQFRVQDTGIGMTPLQMGRLFQEFYQGDSSITRKYGGTGLGLAISKRLVELMGGRIGVLSEPERGSCFTFTVRCDRVEDSLPEGSMPVVDFRGWRVLVVEDHESARISLMDALEVLAFHPAGVESGEQALEKLVVADQEGSPFDLVLMDWLLPGMNGLETTRRIKAGSLLRRVPVVIMVTAYGQREVIPDQTGQDLLDGFLMKPATLRSLSEVIAAAGGPRAGLPGGRVSQPPDLAGIRLLLVEDDEINQQVARELLEQAGIQVVVAGDGQEAVEWVVREPFDGILMDLQMPVMDGLTAARRIRQERSAEVLPIIAMTANAMAGDRERCLAVGMNDHIAKPVVPEVMYAVLARWLPVRSGVVVGGSAGGAPPVRGAGASLPVPPILGVDVVRGLSRVGGNTALYRRVLLKFARNQGGVGQEMARCLESGEWVALEHAAHALKGVSATVGATRLAELAEGIERRSRMAGEAVDLPEWLGTAESELARVVLAIETTLVEPALMISAAELLAEDPVSPEVLAPLFKRAFDYLRSFDSAVEQVVEELAALVRGGRRRERLEAIRGALGSYDFETCWVLFSDWAREEGLDPGGP